MMELKYFLPRPELREYVRAYYYYTTDVAAAQPICAELGNIRFILQGGGALNTPAGGTICNQDAFLLGPTMGAYTMEVVAGTRVFGVGVRPMGWLALVGLSAEEAADRVIDLSALAGPRAEIGLDALKNAGSTDQMVMAADQFFSDILNRSARRKFCAYSHAMARWLLSPNELNLDQLVETMDVSRRQTDRIAKQYFGASPKFLQRKYRALRAADRIRSGALQWRQSAELNFYDQSHFIKEFKTFIGVTPTQFVGNQASLISEIQSRRPSHTPVFPLASF